MVAAQNIIGSEDIIRWSQFEFYATQLMSALHHDIVRWKLMDDKHFPAITKCKKCNEQFTAQPNELENESGWVLSRVTNKHEHSLCFITETSIEQDIQFFKDDDESVEKCVQPIEGANCSPEQFEENCDKIINLLPKYFSYILGHKIKFERIKYSLYNDRIWSGFRKGIFVGKCDCCSMEFGCEYGQDLMILQMFDKFSTLLEKKSNISNPIKWFDEALSRVRDVQSMNFNNPFFEHVSCSRVRNLK